MDRNQLINKIANLSNNLNKKKRAFEENDYGEFYENKLNQMAAQFDRKINLTMESGYLTKSKKEIGKLSDKDLQKLYNKMHDLQTDTRHGTVKKYNNYLNLNLTQSAETLRNTVGDDMFNKLLGDKELIPFMKQFMKDLGREREKFGASYSSEQLMNEMYKNLDIDNDDERKAIMRTIQKKEKIHDILSRNKVSNKGGRKVGNTPKRRR